MKKRQSTFPLRWMEGRNHASNWKCRISLHNNQTTKYKDVKDVSNKKNSRDHKFKYNVGKQTLCRNFLQNIYMAGCQIHGGVFQNTFSKLHHAHPLMNFADIQEQSGSGRFLLPSLVIGDIIHTFDRIDCNLGQQYKSHDKQVEVVQR